MKCEVCGISFNATPLYRNGPKGQVVPWRCYVHVDPQWKPEPEVVDMAETIAQSPDAAGAGRGRR